MVKEKVRNWIKRSKNKRIQYLRVQLLKTKRMLLWLSFVNFFHSFFLRDFVDFKNNLTSILEKKLRTIQPHFERHGSYKKKL